MIVKNKNRILVYLLIILSICALMIGLTVSNQTGSVPAAADQTQASESVEEPYVVYEAVFLDTTEILEVFQTIILRSPFCRLSLHTIFTVRKSLPMAYLIRPAMFRRMKAV